MESNDNKTQVTESSPSSNESKATAELNDLKSSKPESLTKEESTKPIDDDTHNKLSNESKKSASPAPLDENKTETESANTNSSANATANLINEVLQKQLTPLLENLNFASALTGLANTASNGNSTSAGSNDINLSALQQQLVLAAATAALQQQQQNSNDLKLNPTLLAAQLAAMSANKNSNSNSPNKSNGSSPPPASASAQSQNGVKLNWNLNQAANRQLMSPTNINGK
jgi:hypothetical protein